jgi:hypothetical protein
VRDRELFNAMTEAAYRASQACLAQGYGLGDKVTEDSAWAAAHEVYVRERPEEAPISRYSVPVPVTARAPTPVPAPALLPAPPVDAVDVTEPRHSRYEDDDEPF